MRLFSFVKKKIAKNMREPFIFSKKEKGFSHFLKKAFPPSAVLFGYQRFQHLLIKPDHGL